MICRHWQQKLRASWRRGGTFAVCLPVAGTLDELRASWAEVDDAPHVNHFYRADDWRAALGDAGLYADIAHTQQIREHYPDVRAIGTRLRATGAHHVQRSVSPGLTSRRRYAALQAAYERRRTDAGLPLTWQVHYAIFPSTSHRVSGHHDYPADRQILFSPALTPKWARPGCPAACWNRRATPACHRWASSPWQRAQNSMMASGRTRTRGN